jgi:hypothetical protein
MLLSPLQICWGTTNAQKSGDDENLPNVNKTKQPKKMGERKVQDGRTQVQAKRKNHEQGQMARGHEQIKYLNTHHRNIPDKEREGTPERTLSLQEPLTRNISDKEKEGTPERTLACKNHLRQQQPERKLFYFPLFEHPHRCTVCDPEQ